MGEFLVGLTALTLFGSVIWFWLVVALFIVICFASDINENGFFAFGTLVVVSVVSYFWGSETFMYFKSLFTLTNILIYLGVGFGFSTIRAFFASRKLGKELLELTQKSYETLEVSKSNLKKNFIEDLSGNVFRWWFMWPVSLLTWMVKDLISDMWNYCWKKLQGFYLYIVELGIKSV